MQLDASRQEGVRDRYNRDREGALGGALCVEGALRGRGREQKERRGEPKAGCACGPCACRAAGPTRRRPLAARSCRCGSRTLRARRARVSCCTSACTSFVQCTRERERKKGRTPHLEARADLCELDLLVRRLDEDVVPERDEVALVDESHSALGVLSAGAVKGCKVSSRERARGGPCGTRERGERTSARGRCT